MQEEQKKQIEKWTGKDFFHLILFTLITLLFSIRGGQMPEAAWLTLRHIAAYVLYGLIMVLLFLGLTKKMFKLNPSRKKIIKWAFALAAIFSVNQFMHELFLALTGQKGP